MQVELLQSARDLEDLRLRHATLEVPREAVRVEPVIELSVALRHLRDEVHDHIPVGARVREVQTQRAEALHVEPPLLKAAIHLSRCHRSSFGHHAVQRALPV